MTRQQNSAAGFTLVELAVSVTILGIIAVSFLVLFTSLVRSTIVAKRQAMASTLATNQMEYLKSLPYDNLAVAGGSIYSPSPLPATITKKVHGVTYTITTSVNYVDDAFDGCASYPTQQLKELYCRNYPPPVGSPSPDLNPQDYKIARVSVTDPSHARLAWVDTQISARVAETASATGALFVSVIDGNGNKVSGATVTVVNTTVTPNVNVADSTDSNGTAVFYGLPPDTTNYDYQITAAKAGYSTLMTIPPAGGLQPTYPNQRIFTQQSSYVTLTIKPQGSNSLILEAVNSSGGALANLKIYAKGGYKKYTDTANTAYYFDNLAPDTRPTTDANGLAILQNLVPGDYTLCGDAGATSCQIGGTTYYLAAAVPYGGTNPFSPVNVPVSDPSAPPSQTFDFGGAAYLQKVRLILTTQSTFPRIISINPGNVSRSSPTISNFPFTVKGVNLPCSASAAACATSVSFKEGATTFPASCTGDSGGTQLSCSVNLAASTADVVNMVVSANGNTLTLPASPLLGGIVVTP